MTETRWRPEEALDSLTGMYMKNIFFEKAKELLKQYTQKAFILMAVDIEHFKLFNDWYGYEEGNRLLLDISEGLKRLEKSEICVSGYMGSDDFVVLMEDKQTEIAQIQKEITGYTQRQHGDSGFLPAFGIYRVLDGGASISSMYDCAMIALQSVKGNYANRTSVYDSKMKQRMEESQIFLREIRNALQREELTFYLQPICNMNNGRIVGLESLLRWIHPVKGVIPPGDFIPVLEQNGFITKVDLYIWERVCAAISSWIKRGCRPVPTSVNVSRMDLYALDLPEVMKELTEKYEIPPELLEIEITESAYMQDYERISMVTDRLREYGFPVFMDDFGSGYSSLNMLRDVRVDALKIDTKFLEMTPDSMEHGVGILEAVVNLANLMNMKLIAEGVETKDQIHFLKELGCVYAQGYHYYRPMPIEAMEEILGDEKNLDFRGIEALEIRKLSVSELCNKNVISEMMLNHMLGGVAFFDLFQGEMELLRVNEEYFHVTGSDSIDLEENKKHVIDHVVLEDRYRFLKAFQNAKRERGRGEIQNIRYLGAGGRVIWLSLRVFFLREQDHHELYYTSIQNITGQKQQEEALESSQRSLQAVLGLSGYNESFLSMAEENRKTATNIFSQMVPCGMMGGYCEEGFPLYFANDEMVKLLGYATYDEMVEGIGGKVLNTIYEEDRQKVAADIGSNYYIGKEYTTRYRTMRKDGSKFWTMDKGKVVEAEDGRLAIISACIDISDSMEAQEELYELNRRLQIQNIELNYLTNDQPGGYHRCADTEEFDFLFISNRLLEMFGFTTEEIQERFDNKFGRMIHPQDRERVFREMAKYPRGNIYNMEYRMLTSTGYMWVADQTKRVEYNGTVFYYGVILDITSTVEIKEQLERMNRQDRSIVENLLENSAYSFKANLTTDNLVMDESSVRWMKENEYEERGSYSVLVKDAINKVVVSGSTQKMQEFLDREKLLLNYQEGVQSQVCEYQRLYQGKICWMQIIYHLMQLDDTDDIYAYLYTVNINDQKEKEAELTRRAELDELTGLYNRQTALPKIQNYLKKHPGDSAAIVMFDLDNFKSINDNLGHVYGDKVLSEMTRRLKDCFKRRDIICRIGGDEFLAMCRNITEEEICEKLSLVLSQLNDKYPSDRGDISCSVSAGYVMIPEYGIEFQSLYRKADEALFEAKREGKNRFMGFRG